MSEWPAVQVFDEQRQIMELAGWYRYHPSRANMGMLSAWVNALTFWCDLQSSRWTHPQK
jgi:hypothetical protein